MITSHIVVLAVINAIEVTQQESFLLVLRCRLGINSFKNFELQTRC